MNASTLKNSGGKIIPQSDFRRGTTQEVNPFKLMMRGYDIKWVWYMKCQNTYADRECRKPKSWDE